MIPYGGLCGEAVHEMTARVWQKRGEALATLALEIMKHEQALVSRVTSSVCLLHAVVSVVARDPSQLKKLKQESELCSCHLPTLSSYSQSDIGVGLGRDTASNAPLRAAQGEEASCSSDL